VWKTSSTRCGGGAVSIIFRGVVRSFSMAVMDLLLKACILYA
jgi:hypothetical protein